MKTDLEALHEALLSATAARNADKLAEAKLLAAIEEALVAQREREAAMAALDLAMERMRAGL